MNGSEIAGVRCVHYSINIIKDTWELITLADDRPDTIFLMEKIRKYHQAIRAVYYIPDSEKLFLEIKTTNIKLFDPFYNTTFWTNICALIDNHIKGETL